MVSCTPALDWDVLDDPANKLGIGIGTSLEALLGGKLVLPQNATDVSQGPSSPSSSNH